MPSFALKEEDAAVEAVSPLSAFAAPCYNAAF
jgi:hypothetical protein